MSVQVIWMRKVNTRFGKETKRVTATLISASEDWCTVEINGERFAAATDDVKLAKTASAKQ